MKRQIVLLLVLALLFSFPKAMGEKSDPIEDYALPAASDYEDYGGIWYTFQVDMYGVTLNGADLLNQYYVLNADGSAFICMLDNKEKVTDMIWRIGPGGAVMTVSEEWLDDYVMQTAADQADKPEDGFPDEQKAMLRATLTYKLELSDGILKMEMVSEPGLCFYCSRQEPQRSVLPGIISADSGAAFDGTWQWDTMVYNESMIISVDELNAMSIEANDGAETASSIYDLFLEIDSDSGKMTGSFVDSDTYDLLFDDGYLYGTRAVDVLTLNDFFQQMIEKQEGGSAEPEAPANVIIHLCEDGRIRFRWDTEQSNTVDYYFVRIG